MTTSRHPRGTAGGGRGAVSNAYGDVPMNSLQKRHTRNTHLIDDNFHYQHDNLNNTEKEIQSSSSIKHERKKENHSETSFDVKQQKRKMQMGRRSLVRNMETRTQRNLGIKMWPYLSMGVGGFAQNARSWNTLGQERETKDHSDKVRQRTEEHHNNRVRSTEDRTDQCVFLPLGIRGHAHREDVRKHRDPHIRIIAGDFNAQLRRWIDSERDYLGEHTTGQSNKRGIWMKKWLMIQNCAALNTIFFKKKNENNTLSNHQVGRSSQTSW